MLAIARALMSMPETLLLDEPSLGLAPMVVDESFEIMGKINELGISILLVEQNAARALELATYCYVLEGHRDQTLQTRQSPHQQEPGILNTIGATNGTCEYRRYSCTQFKNCAMLST